MSSRARSLNNKGFVGKSISDQTIDGKEELGQTVFVGRARRAIKKMDDLGGIERPRG